jgi:hypothetical protein
VLAACPSGCVPAGGVFNSRVMWRGSDTNPDQAQLMTYMYNPTKKNPCGDDWLWSGATAQRGVWMSQRTYIKLNDVGACISDLIVPSEPVTTHRCWHFSY